MSEFTIPKDFDFNEARDGLDFAEIEELEEMLNIPFTRMAKPGFEPPMKMIRAVLWMAMRKENPEIQFNDLLGLKLTSLFQEVEELDPTN